MIPPAPDVVDLLARLPEHRTWLLWPGWRAARGWALALLLAALFPGSALGGGVAAGLVLLLLAATGYLRARRLLRERLAIAVAVALHADPGQVRVGWRRWRGRTLRWAEVRYPTTAPAHDPGRRAAVATAVHWALGRPGARYVLTWKASAYRLRVQAAPQLPATAADGSWTDQRGRLHVVPLGVCAAEDATTHAPPAGQRTALPLACWDPSSERDLLIAGVKGAGKTVLARGVIVRALALHAVGEVHVFDGKGSGDYAALEGRTGIAAVLRTPEQWTAAIGPLRTEMRARYEAAYAHQAGHGPRPTAPRLLLVLDEVQRMIREPGMKEFLDDLARMARGANFRLVLITQRPDATDAIPGAIRDQLEDRVIVGWMSPVGARMVLGEDAAALTDTDSHQPRGRAVARLGGRLVHFQTLWLPTPIDDPEAEHLYPPRPVRTAAVAAEPLHLVPTPRNEKAPAEDVLVGAGWGSGRRARKPSA